jgi:NADH-quinone oxidoreductase subunit L
VTATAAILTVALPAIAATCGLLLARSRAAAVRWAVLGAGGSVVASVVELCGVLTSGGVESIRFLGQLDLGVGSVDLDLRSDGLSASVAIAVSVVATCVQIYSTAYLSGDGTPDAPTRFRAYAAEVSLFTASMMLVVHADDLILLMLGWEGMGICSYLLIGHHSERATARAAAVKAFLVTRVGDLGVLVAIVVLLLETGTTSIRTLLARAGELPVGVLTAVTLLLLTGVAGKSAQFPLHTWLPDAMEGPTPVSALIHAATMVAAGVYLVARLLPLFLVADAALQAAAVIAAITMLGAAVAAVGQDDLKRLLAYSTVSQVAFMLAGVAVARSADEAAPGVFHLLSHAGFKALLFLLAGCVTHVVHSTLLKDMGGLRHTHPSLAWLFAFGLAALAGIPPFSGFWSKEAVLTAAEHAVSDGGGWAPLLVLVSGLLTTVVTGLYAGRAFSIVVLGAPPPAPRGEAHHVLPHVLPRAMTWPLWVLAVPTVGLGLVLLHPPEVVASAHVGVVTAVTGTLLSLVGVGWALASARWGERDVAQSLPAGVRVFLREGYRLDAVQNALFVKPYKALAKLADAGDSDLVDAYPRGSVVLARWGGLALRRTQAGLANGYVAWVLIGAVAVGLAGVVLA